ncbi:helix-turn-helix domain-containing protein [Streptosporangium sp. NPDC002607]
MQPCTTRDFSDQRPWRAIAETGAPFLAAAVAPPERGDLLDRLDPARRTRAGRRPPLRVVGRQPAGAVPLHPQRLRRSTHGRQTDPGPARHYGGPATNKTSPRNWTRSPSSASALDPIGKLLFTALAMVAEFEADLIRMRTREGMKIAKVKGRLRGKKPKLNARQAAHLVALHKAGEHTSAELAELFGVARSTVYRAVERAAGGQGAAKS